jgi:Type II secretion system (T2SS), protein K
MKMNRTRRSTNRPAFLLLLVLLVVSGISLTSLSLSDSMLMNFEETLLINRSTQARCAADSGINAARMILANTKAARLEIGGIWNNPTYFQAINIVADSDPKELCHYSIVAPDLDAQGNFTSARFGLQNESAKLNLNALVIIDRLMNSASAASAALGQGSAGLSALGVPSGLADVTQVATSSGGSGGTGQKLLLGLPSMTPDIADAILDFIDEDDEPRAYGAESEYYSQLPTPYAAANGPIYSVDELLRVRGVTPQLLFGFDQNRNGVLETFELTGTSIQSLQSSATTAELDDGTVLNTAIPMLGWAQYFTLYSREKNVDSTGAPRININSQDLTQLDADLDTALGNADWASFIIAYRANGPGNANGGQQGGGGGGQGSGRGGDGGGRSGDGGGRGGDGGGRGGDGGGRGGDGGGRGGDGGGRGGDGGGRGGDGGGRGEGGGQGGGRGRATIVSNSDDNPSERLSRILSNIESDIQFANQNVFSQRGGLGGRPNGENGQGGGGQGAGNGQGQGGQRQGGGGQGGRGGLDGGGRGGPGFAGGGGDGGGRGNGGAGGPGGGRGPGGDRGGPDGGGRGGPDGGGRGGPDGGGRGGPDGGGRGGPDGGGRGGPDGGGRGGPGGGGGAPGGGGGGNSPAKQVNWKEGAIQVDLTQPGKGQFSQILDLIGATITVQQNNESVTYRSPFQADPAAMALYLPVIMDKLTTVDGPVIPGRININEAPREVIAGIPGMTTELVDVLMEARAEQSETENRKYETWPMVEGLITLEQMKSLLPLVTAGGDVYKAQSIGYFEQGAAFARIEAIIDSAEAIPTVVAYRRMDHLGRGFSNAVLGQRATGLPMTGK